MEKFEVERFEELAGMFEFDDGMSRFSAETKAAARFGMPRWKAMEAANADRVGNSEAARDRGRAA